MTIYRVSFFNELTNSSGKLFKVCQRSVEIRTARTLDRAIEAAKKRFARLEHIGEWRLHARLFEVEALVEAQLDVAPSVKYARARRPASGQPVGRRRVARPHLKP
jgi:hypothetical protein